MQRYNCWLDATRPRTVLQTLLLLQTHLPSSCKQQLLQLLGRHQARGTQSVARAAAAHVHADIWAAVLQAMIANCNIMGKPIIITRLVDTMSSNPRPTRCCSAARKGNLMQQTAVRVMKCSAACLAPTPSSRKPPCYVVCQPTCACKGGCPSGCFETPHPWCRAEATDVANAVMDGADAFLLGAETLRGFHPVLTIATILSIARQAEAVFDHTHHFDHLMTVSVQLYQPPVAYGWGPAGMLSTRDCGAASQEALIEQKRRTQQGFVQSWWALPRSRRAHLCRRH